MTLYVNQVPNTTVGSDDTRMDIWSTFTTDVIDWLFEINVLGITVLNF